MIRFEFEKINIKINNTVFFENTSYEFSPSKFYSLLGESNSGKTIFINSLMEHSNITSGIIRINGILSTSYNSQNLGIYLLNQEPIYFKSLTVSENLFPKDNEKSLELLDKFGLKLDLNTSLSLLSKKELFMINFIRYLIFPNLSLLFIDDFSLLKSQENEDFFIKFFREIKSRGITVVIIDYQISDFYLEFIDEVLLVNNKNIEVKSRETYLSNNTARYSKSKNKLIDINTFDELSFEKNKIYGIICNDKNIKHQLTDFLMDSSQNVTTANLNSTDSLFSNLSIFENTIVSSKRVKKIKSLFNFLELLNLQKERDKIESFIKKLNLSTKNIDTHISELGLGDQKKIILARYLLSGYEMLILFNLFNSIDNSTKVDIANLLLQYSRRNKTVIIFDNNLHDLNMICANIFNINV